ncbi:transposase domain-containing protein [Thalassomonas viridans]|uniref:Transposase domain-containing protein n=1 Tax=Thalassomonas viridans TaxID=137584 RepID=A0AAE9ZCJ5_9GAMM|nr:transposase domain-containing protein [Thalassomonas viridans]
MKANGLTPFNYLMHCLEQLANKEVGLELLLPWQVNIS